LRQYSCSNISGSHIVDDKDLIYEGIATSAATISLRSLVFHDDKDLIYEGIATISVLTNIFSLAIDDKDLIYEGIATIQKERRNKSVLSTRDDKDLIYEGIATFHFPS